MTPAASRGRQQDLDGAVYVFGVVAPDVPAEVLDAHDLVLVTQGDVAAVVVGYDLDEPPRPSTMMRSHQQVLDAVAVETAVIPFQYGTVQREVGDVEQMLVEDEELWSGLLAALRGRSQFRVRARYDEEEILREVVLAEPEIASLRAFVSEMPEDAARSERLRLGELVSGEVARRRDVDSSDLLDEVLAHAVAWSDRERAELDHLIDVAVLIEEDQVEAFEEDLERLAARLHPRARLQLTGPTAPYDFTDGDWWV